jgi:hypothetical protein
MSLTPSDIVWYHAAYDVGKIIVSCGEYPNVPLLGMRGGISYNSILARRQFGYPMRITKPDNIALNGEFYLSHEDCSNKTRKFEQAWHAIRRLDRNQLGKSQTLYMNLTLNGSLIELQVLACPTTCRVLILNHPTIILTLTL